MRVLILLDEPTLKMLKQGEPPLAAFSHDKNLFQFAHESLRKGYTVLVTASQGHPTSRPYYRVESVYPVWKHSPDVIYYADAKPDIVVSVFMESLNIRDFFPHPKIVAIQAAIHWVESPDNFSARYLFDTITAARFNVDFIITQNVRMKNLLDVFYRFVAKVPFDERILVSPLGIVEEERRVSFSRAATRREMGLKDDDIAIINSGGVWRWTDFNTFLRGFCAHLKGQKRSRLKLFMMGLRQPGNKEHDQYHDETSSILAESAAYAGKNIVLMEDWFQASRKVKSYTASADIGLNVSKPGLENWQSYRLRFLDYMVHGIPVINTMGDEMADERAASAIFPVVAGNVDSYRSMLDGIASQPQQVGWKASAMRDLALHYDSRATYGAAIDAIVAMPRRPLDDHSAWPESLLDYARHRAIDDATGKIAAGLREWMVR